jgi:hypothetical protein
MVKPYDYCKSDTILTKEIIQGTTTLKMNHTWANWVCKETYISDAKEWK